MTMKEALCVCTQSLFFVEFPYGLWYDELNTGHLPRNAKRKKEGRSMKKKTVVLIIVLLVVAVACGLLIHRAWYLKQLETINGYIFNAWQQTYSEDAPAYLDAIAWETLYQLDGYEKGNPWILHMTVMGVDLGKELKNADLSMFTKDSTEKEINDYLVSLVKQAEKTKISTYIYAWPEGDGFRIEFSETFIDAMSGKVYSYAKEILLDYMGGALE